MTRAINKPNRRPDSRHLSILAFRLVPDFTVKLRSGEILGRTSTNSEDLRTTNSESRQWTIPAYRRFAVIKWLIAKSNLAQPPSSSFHLTLSGKAIPISRHFWAVPASAHLRYLSW